MKSAIGIVLTSLFILTARSFANESFTPLESLYKEYLEGVRSLQSASSDRASLRKFNQTWETRFAHSLAEADEADRGKQQVLSELMALQTSNGNLAGSKRSNKELIASTQSSIDQTKLLMNLAEIELLDFDSNGGVSAEEVKRAMETAFDNLKAEFRAVDIVQGISFAQKYASFLLKQEHPAEAAEVYLFAANKMDSASTEHKQRLGSIQFSSNAVSPYSVEWALDSAMMSFIKAKEEDAAEKLFLQLIDRSDLKMPRSYYLYRKGVLIDPHLGPKFRSIAREWLKSQPADKWTHYLKFYLARSYFENQDYTNAAKFFSEVAEGRIGSGITENSNSQPDGFSAEVLFGLAYSLHKLGEKEEAAALFNSFKQLFPNDKRNQLIPSK